MHPRTFEVYQLQKSIPGGQKYADALLGAFHLHVSQNIFDAAQAFAMAAIEDDGFIESPIGSRLPAQCVAITIEQDGGASAPYVALLTEEDGRVSITFLIANGEVKVVGAYTPGSDEIVLMRNLKIAVFDFQSAEHFARNVLTNHAFAISLINEPRRVSVSKASGLDWTRQYRKQLHRNTGMAVMAYSKVSWQIGAGVKAKNSKDGDSDLKVALHYSRSHWRRCDPDNVHAEWVSKFLGGAPGWHQWIKGAWKGHPDHGIKLQRYEPRMIGERSQAASRYADRVGKKDSEARLACMSDEIRSKLVQAGFAPTALLH